MASGWRAANLTQAEIADGESYHRALYHEGDVERPAGWHRDSISHLLDLVMPHITDGSLVVDYGAGSGGSAFELLKRTDEAGLSIELVMVDPLVSWFGKARELLDHRDEVLVKKLAARDLSILELSLKEGLREGGAAG